MNKISTYGQLANDLLERVHRAIEIRCLESIVDNETFTSQQIAADVERDLPEDYPRPALGIPARTAFIERMVTEELLSALGDDPENYEVIPRD